MKKFAIGSALNCEVRFLFKSNHKCNAFIKVGWEAENKMELFKTL